jgi:hypothetical protein
MVPTASQFIALLAHFLFQITHRYRPTKTVYFLEGSDFKLAQYLVPDYSPIELGPICGYKLAPLSCASI